MEACPRLHDWLKKEKLACGRGVGEIRVTHSVKDWGTFREA
jgi:hypothetical protein